MKLQEAIYELVCGEEDLVKDLMMIQKNYADPMVQLHIMSSAEVSLFHDSQSVRNIQFERLLGHSTEAALALLTPACLCSILCIPEMKIYLYAADIY